MVRAHRFLLVLGWAAISGAAAGQVSAATLYVDNTQGSDAFDGHSAKASSNETGPTLTIRRALELAQPGDTVVIANTGTPYYEGVSLVGRRHSGVLGRPFTIVGNGAVIDGSSPVHPKAWRPVGADLWRFTPWRKGYFQLILDGKPIAEHTPKAAGDTRPPIPAGKWMVWKGSIYYQGEKDENPAKNAFRYAARSVGITIYEANDVQISNLNVRFFRLDGINAHDRSLRVAVENVTAFGNGRSGIAINGTSAVVVRSCVVAGNRKHSVLLTELGAAKVEDSKLSQPPTLPK